MPSAVVYVLYALTVAVVVGLSMKIGKYVDVIDQKSKISGAFISGVMLAAVTSLPELFTSLSAVWIVGESSLVIGNILGSNLINLAFMGGIFIVFFKGFKKASFNRFYFVGLFVGLAMFALVAVGLFFGGYLKLGWYNAVSPCLLILYVLYLLKMPKTADGDGEKSEDPLTLKQAVIRFSVCAVILVGASMALTYLTDTVAELLDVGKTFAGALFLGVATSLPELVSSVTLCARGNFNASAGNFIGSNVFNFTILFVADILSFGSNSVVYVKNAESVYLLIFGAAATVAAAVMLALTRAKKRKKAALFLAETSNAVAPALYIMFLLLSTGIIQGMSI